MYNARLLEFGQVADMGSGKWVSLSNYRRVAMIVTGAGLQTLTAEQGQVAGANPKALNFTRVDWKASGDEQFTEVIQAAANTYTTATAVDLAVIEFKEEDLDMDGGFSTVNLVASGAGVVTAVLFGARYERNPALGA